MRIYEYKVCDKCRRNTHHVDYPCCRWCSGMVNCKECEKKARTAPPATDSLGRPTFRKPRINTHHRKYDCCWECAKAKN